MEKINLNIFFLLFTLAPSYISVPCRGMFNKTLGGLSCLYRVLLFFGIGFINKHSGMRVAISVPCKGHTLLACSKMCRSWHLPGNPVPLIRGGCVDLSVVYGFYASTRFLGPL